MVPRRFRPGRPAVANKPHGSRTRRRKMATARMAFAIQAASASTITTDRSTRRVPFGGSRILHPAAFPSPGRSALSWSSPLFRVLFVPTYQGCWVTPIPSLPHRFRWTVWSSVDTGPRLLAKAGASSRELRAPSESLRAVICPLRCRSGRLPWAFSPLHDVSTQSPRLDGHPRSICVPPSAFRALSTGCSSVRLANLFRSAAVSRVLAPGVFSHDPAVPARRWPFPSRRWCRRLPVARRQRTSRRPQGVAPNRDPRCPAGGLVPRVTRVPSCVFSSLRLCCSDLGGAITPPPLTAFVARCCVCTVRLTPSVSISLCPDSLSPESPPVRASRPDELVALPDEARRFFERSGVTADGETIEHPACQPQRSHNPVISKFRIALGNVGLSDRGVDNLRNVCVGGGPTYRGTHAWLRSVAVSDTCAGSARSVDHSAIVRAPRRERCERSSPSR